MSTLGDDCPWYYTPGACGEYDAIEEVVYCQATERYPYVGGRGRVEDHI